MRRKRLIFSSCGPNRETREFKYQVLKTCNFFVGPITDIYIPRYIKHDMYILDTIRGLPCNQSRQAFGSKNPNLVSLLTSLSKGKKNRNSLRQWFLY